MSFKVASLKIIQKFIQKNNQTFKAILLLKDF